MDLFQNYAIPKEEEFEVDIQVHFYIILVRMVYLKMKIINSPLHALHKSKSHKSMCFVGSIRTKY